MHLRGHEENYARAMAAYIFDETLRSEARRDDRARAGGATRAQEDPRRRVGQWAHDQVHVVGTKIVRRAELIRARAFLLGGTPAALRTARGAGRIEQCRADLSSRERAERLLGVVEEDRWCPGGNARSVCFVHHHRPRASVPDDPLDLLWRKPRVDRREHQACRGRRISRSDEAGTVPRDHRDAIALADAEAAQSRQHRGCAPGDDVLVEENGIGHARKIVPFTLSARERHVHSRLRNWGEERSLRADRECCKCLHGHACRTGEADGRSHGGGVAGDGVK